MHLLAACFLMMINISPAFMQIPASRTKWDGLRVTWGLDLRNPNYFVKYPRTTSEAIADGFKKIGDCDLNAKWRGERYVRGHDFTVALLFDINGFIAGIQTTVPKNQSTTYPSPKIQPPFVDDGDRWTISAYFIDPARICTTGRSAADFSKEGTGLNVYIQNTSVPEESVLAPYYEADTKTTQWKKGRCVTYMGWHYYLDLRIDLPCDQVYPVFLLYNGGELNAFGWTLLTNMPSTRYEHSESPIFKYFMDPVPTCMYDVGTVSCMHIYLTDNVERNVCK